MVRHPTTPPIEKGIWKGWQAGDGDAAGTYFHRYKHCTVQAAKGYFDVYGQLGDFLGTFGTLKEALEAADHGHKMKPDNSIGFNRAMQSDRHGKPVKSDLPEVDVKSLEFVDPGKKYKITNSR